MYRSDDKAWQRIIFSKKKIVLWIIVICAHDERCDGVKSEWVSEKEEEGERKNMREFNWL